MGGHAEKQKLARARQENLERSAGTVRLRRARNKLADKIVELAEAAHCFVGNGTRESTVALREPARGKSAMTPTKKPDQPSAGGGASENQA